MKWQAKLCINQVTTIKNTNPEKTNAMLKPHVLKNARLHRRTERSDVRHHRYGKLNLRFGINTPFKKHSNRLYYPL